MDGKRKLKRKCKQAGPRDVQVDKVQVVRRRVVGPCTIQDAVESKEGRTYQATSIGYNTDGEEVARFMVTWSFKAKS